MVRTRVILLVTIAALLAPSIALCLIQAPAGHAAMPCCRTTSDGVPAARPCCGTPDDDASTPPASAASRVQPGQVMSAAGVLASNVAVLRPLGPSRPVAPAVSARLRPTVLLI